KTTLHLSWQQLPWGIFLFYIIILDQLDLMINTIDFLIESYYDIRLFIVLQFLGRFYCQIIPMLYNFIKHFHSILFIIFTIITLKYYLSPWQQLNKSLKQIKQIIHNILILIIVIIIIINCQYIWTYDLSKLEIFILHERILHNVYKCDYASIGILNSIYLNYIWPILDYIIGDIIPCIVCLLSSIIGYVINQYMKKSSIILHHHHHNNKIITIMNNNYKQNHYKEAYNQMYTKWIVSKIINHNNVHNHAMDEIISQTDHSLLNKINQIIEFLKPYEIYLEYYEIILRFLNFIEIPIRSILLLSSIEEYKLNCYTQLSIIKKLLKQLSFHLYYKLIQYKNKLSIINHNKFNRQLQRFNDINKHSLLLNDNNINKEIIEMSNYVNKAQYHSNDVIDNKKEASSSSSSSILNKQTSLINEYKLNYTTTYKQNSSKCDMIRNNQPLNIDPFTLNIPIVNIKSKLDWYNFTKHQFNSKDDNSSLEQSTGIHRIFYL
ncbi:U3 small nucleolar RNA associated 22, partial [Schistosoma japonicum]